MIFTDPASAVSQPKPTPATVVNIPNTTVKISNDIARGRQERSDGPISPFLAQMPHPHPNQERQRDPGGGFDRDPTVTKVMPRTFRPWKVSAMPAAIRPTISISLCTPPIRWMSTSGLSTQIHIAIGPLLPRW